MCFAARMSLELLIPSACEVGYYYQGHMPLGSLIDEAGSYLAPTLETFISMSERISHTRGHVHLQSSVVNAVLGVESTSASAGSDRGEVVSYIVIPRAAVSIAGTSGTPPRLEYSIIGSVSSNWIFYPRADPVLQSLANPNK
jgi:hypothetical protein